MQEKIFERLFMATDTASIYSICCACPPAAVVKRDWLLCARGTCVFSVNEETQRVFDVLRNQRVLPAEVCAAEESAKIHLNTPMIQQNKHKVVLLHKTRRGITPLLSPRSGSFCEMLPRVFDFLGRCVTDV